MNPTKEWPSNGPIPKCLACDGDGGKNHRICTRCDGTGQEPLNSRDLQKLKEEWRKWFGNGR